MVCLIRRAAQFIRQTDAKQTILLAIYLQVLINRL